MSPRHAVSGLGKRLRERRESLKLTQDELADLMGGKASLEQIGHYECERRSPAAAALVDLARALRCSTDYLLGIGDMVQDLARPRTPPPKKSDEPKTIDQALAMAKARGITFTTYLGRSYRLRRDGWEPV